MSFICEINKEIILKKKQGSYDKEFISDNLWFAYNSNNKFENDKIFFENDLFFIFLDGVILNKKELLLKGNVVSLIEYFLEALKKGDDFLEKLRGSFLGLIYSKKNKSYKFFNDHIGSKPLFYSQVKTGSFILSSNLDWLYSYKNNNKLETKLSLDSAYMLLSYGYLINEFTLDEFTKKLNPGSFLEIKNFLIVKENYYKFSFKYENTCNEDDLIEELDLRFRKVIKLAFDKDIEYNYKHLCGLSGGLDSRMTVWVAHDMGYTNQLNFTFSQSDYLDETIAKEIARDLGHEWVFKYLDYGHILLPIEKNMRLNAGNSSYFGVSHTADFYSNLNFDNYGLLHTGQLGDAIIGAAAFNITNNVNQKLSNINFVNKINNIKAISNKYSNPEDFFIYNRGINGANSGLNSIFPYTETFSPFYDVDFMNFCFSIPEEKRANHDIYKKWIIKKYPKAADYIWESSKQKIKTKRLQIKYKGSKIPLSSVYQILKAKFFKKQDYAHMNPIDYWFCQNKELKEKIDTFFNLNINLIENIELRTNARFKFENGKVSDKLEVITLLSAIKNYF
jgi:asparagine synthase (glutamine-hydrolysing)